MQRRLVGFQEAANTNPDSDSEEQINHDSVENHQANKITSSLLVHFSEPPSHADTKNTTSAGPTSPLHYSGT